MRRGGGSLIVVLFLLLLMLAGVAAGLAVLAPARLSVPQEQLIGLVRGRIVEQNEVTVVGNCNAEQAVPRTERFVRFGDGTEMRVIITHPPISCE